MKLVTIFFDLEAPFLWKNERRFDLEKTMSDIRGVLDRFEAKAVFNTCGVVAENFPGLIAALHDEGHEIASHGYAHENLARASLTEIGGALAKAEQVLQRATGEKPAGLRAPWLATTEEVYSVLADRGYRWASNSHVPFWATKSHIDLGKTPYLKYALGRTIYEFKRLSQKKRPFRKGPIVEMPLLSPMDIFCIYPFPQAHEDSPETSLEEAYGILLRHYKHSKAYFNLNLHEHVIGTANRIQLLERILDHISKQRDTSYILPNQIASSLH